PSQEGRSDRRAQDSYRRLQGRQAAGALSDRAGQDPAAAFVGGFGAPPAPARRRDQAGALPRTAALHQGLQGLMDFPAAPRPGRRVTFGAAVVLAGFFLLTWPPHFFLAPFV